MYCDEVFDPQVVHNYCPEDFNPTLHAHVPCPVLILLYHLCCSNTYPYRILFYSWNQLDKQENRSFCNRANKISTLLFVPCYLYCTTTLYPTRTACNVLLVLLLYCTTCTLILVLHNLLYFFFLILDAIYHPICHKQYKQVLRFFPTLPISITTTITCQC